MFKFLAALGLAMLLWFPQHANAACTFNTTDGLMPRIRFPAFDTGAFDPDAIPVGGVIAMSTAVQTSAENGVDPANISWSTSCGSGVTFRGNTAPAPITLNGKPVYPTALAGVGLAMKSVNCAPAGTYWPVSDAYAGNKLTLGCKIQVEIIKTGPVTGGTLGGEFAGYYVGQPTYATQVVQLLFSGEIHVTPNRPTCAPTVTDKIVDMGNMDVGSVTDDGYSDPVNFNMDVVCSGGVPADKTAQMAVTFTDATDTTNNTNLLKLTSASTASGVKVQLLKGGVPVTFGPEPNPASGTDPSYALPLGTIQNGTYSFPMAARYAQTGPVTAGSANAIATFTYTYH